MKKIVILLFALLFSACAPTIKNFDSYEKQFLTKASYMPNQENLSGKQPKVVVFALDENSNEVATQAQLGNSIANDIENILSKNQLAEIVDRKAGAKLKKEIALAEMNKSGSYKGPIIADYAISGSISNAGFTSKYSAGALYADRRGQIITVPPQYNYSSDIAGNIKIYELPSLAVASLIEFSGRKSRSENVQQDGGLSVGAIQIGGNKVKGASRDDSLVRKAGQSAIFNSEIDIKNFFAKKGYILEKRVYKDKSIFKITLGLSDGIKQGDKLEVIGKYDSQNPITGELEVEKRIIAKGAVSDHIDPNTSWVIIDNAKDADKIRLGDVVKIKYNKNAFSQFTKVAISTIE